MVGGVDPFIQDRQKRFHAQDISSIGQLPEPSCRREVRIAGWLKLAKEGLIVLGHPRHLIDVQGLDIVVEEKMLHPFAGEQVHKISIIGQITSCHWHEPSGYAMFVWCSRQEIHDRIRCIL